MTSSGASLTPPLDEKIKPAVGLFMGETYALAIVDIARPLSPQGEG
jgi:hypothetical protein